MRPCSSYLPVTLVHAGRAARPRISNTAHTAAASTAAAAAAAASVAVVTDSVGVLCAAPEMLGAKVGGVEVL